MTEHKNNPFALVQQQNTRPTSGALATTDQQRAIAEVQAGMMIARMNQRDEMRSMDRILNACTRPTLAESAVYTYSRGGSDISGPSIRLAEAMAQSWGNLSFGIRELEQDSGESTVQAFCWDMETNVRREMTFQVAHTRHTRSGSKRLEDPRDIYEHVANQGARRLRSCILAIIPGDVTEAAVTQCELTMKSQADTSPEALQRMIEAFALFGVTKEQIEKRIQRRLEAIRPAQVVSLRKIHNSLKDGMSIPSDWFDEQVNQTVSDLNNELKGKSGKKTGTKPEEKKEPVSQNPEMAEARQEMASPDAQKDGIVDPPAKVLKEMADIDVKMTVDEVDIWRSKHYPRLVKFHGQEWADFLIQHCDKRVLALRGEGSPAEKMETIKCPEAGNREVLATDCELSECSKMCPAFNMRDGNPAVREMKLSKK
jgi:hypothetical protein